MSNKNKNYEHKKKLLIEKGLDADVANYLLCLEELIRRIARSLYGSDGSFGDSFICKSCGEQIYIPSKYKGEVPTKCPVCKLIAP